MVWIIILIIVLIALLTCLYMVYQKSLILNYQQRIAKECDEFFSHLEQQIPQMKQVVTEFEKSMSGEEHPQEDEADYWLHAFDRFPRQVKSENTGMVFVLSHFEEKCRLENKRLSHQISFCQDLPMTDEDCTFFYYALLDIVCGLCKKDGKVKVMDGSKFNMYHLVIEMKEYQSVGMLNKAKMLGFANFSEYLSAAGTVKKYLKHYGLKVITDNKNDGLKIDIITK